MSAGSIRIGVAAILLGGGLLGCEERVYDCAEFLPTASTPKAKGSFRVHYAGGIGELVRDRMTMFVERQGDTHVYLTGCTNDADGMWDVEVVSSVPEGTALPAAFGIDDTAPTLVVRVYHYREGEESRAALFDEKNQAEVDGNLEALDLVAGELALEASLEKPCVGDCSSERSKVEVEAQLSWNPSDSQRD